MKKKATTLVILMLLCSLGFGQTTAKPAFTSFIDSVSFAYGYGLGMQIEKSGIKLNYPLLYKGLNATSSKDLPLTQEQIATVMAKFQDQLRAIEQAKIDKQAAENLEKANKFLEENKLKPNVTTTQSGLQYEILSKVDTPEKPSPQDGDMVEINFEGYFLNDQKFESTIERKSPITIELNNAIEGWKEALKMMKEGDMYMLFVPPHLGYGKEGYDIIPPNELLKFKLELVKIIPKVTN